MPPIGNPQIAENQRIFKKAQEKASNALSKNDLNSAIAWSKIAAHFAFLRHPGVYMSPELENLLLEVARRIEQEPPDVSGAFYLKTKPKNFGKMRFLHVLTESYSTGGHSPFVARWIRNTLDSSVHSVIATAQTGELADILRDAVGISGGYYCSLSELSGSLVEQALLLRLLAQNWADTIVLLTHPFDPIPCAAFGVNGGPPVIYCNHADHAFWLGRSIADITVNYHSSAQELNARRRGIPDSKLLPIPLSKNSPPPQNQWLRHELGFCEQDVVLLSVGRPEKFYPFGGYDFLGEIVEFLTSHPDVKLVVAGPEFVDRWRSASAEVQGRIRALGTVSREELEKYYSAADVYVASFPCGSGTSMLEAAMHNLPVIGLHLSELPHLSLEDDVGFSNLGVHKSSIKDFLEALDLAVQNCRSSSQRIQAGLIKENVERAHCSPGWNSYLDAVLQSLPSQHTVHPPPLLKEETDYTDIYWEHLSSQMLSNELPQHSFSRLVRVYGRHLSKGDMLAPQAESLMSAFTKIDNFKRTRQFFMDFKEFVSSAFESRVSA